MKILQLIKAGFALVALAGLLLGGTPVLAGSEVVGDFKTLSQAAIEQAAALINERAKAASQDDEDAQDRLRDAEKELRRAQNRFGSGNYDGALDHTKDVEEILK